MSIIKDRLSVVVLDQYGPTLGFEEEEDEQVGAAKPMLSFAEEDHQVLISEGSSRISFRKSTLVEDDRAESDRTVFDGEQNGNTVVKEDWDL